MTELPFGQPDVRGDPGPLQMQYHLGHVNLGYALLVNTKLKEIY